MPVSSRASSVCGRRTFTALLPPTILLAVLIVVVRWVVTPNAPGAVWVQHDSAEFEFKWMDHNDIKAELDALQDRRSRECISTRYQPLAKDDSVSILLTFHEHEFNNLKATLESVIKHTPDNLYNEIIVLDDGSVQDSVRKEASKYMDDARFHKVKGYRSEKVDGVSLSRFKAARVATGKFLVFLSTKVVVNEGWLEPLLDIVKSEPTVVAVPHMDRLLEGPRFIEIPLNMINSFGWSLTTYYREAATHSAHMDTPVMTGEAFVVSKLFLEEIGTYDDGMEQGSGETLELSFRAWMCGGSIKVITCSRVAVKEALLPHRIQSQKNLERIMKLWLSDEQQTVVYKHYNATKGGGMNQEDVDKLRVREMYLKKTTAQCRDFDWYLNRHKEHIREASESYNKLGKVQSEAGYCIQGHMTNKRVEMVPCRPHIYEPEMIYEQTGGGQLMNNNGECLQLNPDKDVELGKCDPEAPAQVWKFYSHQKLFNTHYRDYCLTHKPTSQRGVHYLVVNICSIESKNVPEREFKWKVIQY